MAEVKSSCPGCVGEGGLQKLLGHTGKSTTARGQEDVHPQKPFVQRTLWLKTDSTGTVRAAEGWWYRVRVSREAPAFWRLGIGSRSV